MLPEYRPLPQIPDAVLAEQAIGGDMRAFAELYQRHERHAYRRAYRITGTIHDAADATQIAFAKVLARLPRMGDREMRFFRAYLMAAVTHACFDVLAANGRAQPAGSPTDADWPAANRAADDDGLDHGLMLAVQREEIRIASSQLPARQHQALTLRVLEGLSYAEIAERMNLNTNAVAQLIRRAKIGLHNALRQA